MENIKDDLRCAKCNKKIADREPVYRIVVNNYSIDRKPVAFYLCEKDREKLTKFLRPIEDKLKQLFVEQDKLTEEFLKSKDKHEQNKN